MRLIGIAATSLAALAGTALAIAGCGSGERGTAEGAHVRSPVAIQQSDRPVPELRGRSVRQASRLLLGRGLVPAGAPASAAGCVVVQQSPVPGGTMAHRTVEIWHDCRHPSGSCGLVRSARGIEIARRSGRVACRIAQTLFLQYTRRTDDGQGEGNGVNVRIGPWECGRRSPGSEPRLFAAYAGCSRGKPSAEVVFILRG